MSSLIRYLREKNRRSTIQPKRKTRRGTCRRRSTTENFSEIPGLFQVKMSSSLQNELRCVIGINITSTDRWMYIYKQKLLDELKNKKSYENQGLLNIKIEIKAFPDETILIGLCEDDKFLLCLSQYAKNVCENWKEEEKKNLLEKLRKILARDAHKWNTLGSDGEIERISCFRSPFSMEVVLQPNVNAKFGLRLVADAKDGYAEFVNTRTTFNVLFRKRIDKASQISKLKTNKQTQTVAPTWTHLGVQNNCTNAEVKATKAQKLKLNEWFALHYSNISSHLKFNAHVDIYTNDYTELPNQRTRYSIKNPSLLISFYDCISCPHKVVNCITWNAFASGVVATAYTNICPRFITNHQPPTYEESHLTEMGTHLVLIWSVTQPSKPLLYLHAMREITALNFCPYDPNILVGGCLYGQVIVWDIRGLLDSQREEVSLRTAEVDVLINEKMSWMKYPPDEYNVFPSVESKDATCHKSRITMIQWLPPEYKLNSLGEFVKCAENVKHMQFLTTAISDSTMLVWDLKPKNIRVAPKKKQIKHRLSSRPQLLDEKTSSLSKLNFCFKPVFKLNFVDANTNGPIHVSDFSFNMGSFAYLALNPDTTDNVFERTYFIRNTDNENFEVEKTFLAATEFGQLYQCSWTAFSYDRGLEINSQQIDTAACRSYHDGPIYNMQRSPFFANLVLTTGGRVFAIWNSIGDHIKTPLIWRKSAIRYVMVVWSLQNRSSLIASREDGQIELWDFDEDSKSPLRMTKLIGHRLLSLFVNNNLQHVMKGTCFATDFNGILSIYDVSSNLFVNNQKSKLHYNLQGVYKRRELVKYWSKYVSIQKQKIDEKQDCESETQDEASKRRSLRLSSQTKRMSFEYKMPPENIWQENEYKRMYKILIEKHRINLDNIEQNKGPLNKMIESRYARIKKIDRYIANKEKIFQEEKSKVTFTSVINKKRKVSIHFPNELVKVLKKQYYENYKIAEIEATKYIQCHRFRYFFDWQAMIIFAKRRYHGEMLPGSSEKLPNEFNKQKFMSLIPANVGRRSTKLLMTEIALVTSISGK